MLLGLIQLPVTNLQKPPRDSRLLHESDLTSVRKIITVKDPAGPEASSCCPL